MRQRNKPWADNFLKENEHFVIPNPSSWKGNWNEIFGNSNPIHLEIGTGKGQFLAKMAEQYPTINFIGIELAKSIIVTAAQKLLKTEQKNIAMINENAQKLQELFAENEISTIYLNFSDPWPKSRHEKRRLTYSTFLEQYQHILNPDGEIVQKTDNQGLFEYSLVSFSTYGMKLKEVNLDLDQLEDPSNMMTEYEEKFSAKGHGIYRCRAVFPYISG